MAKNNVVIGLLFSLKVRVKCEGNKKKHLVEHGITSL